MGGSVPYIMGEYFKALTEAGEEIVPGSESHWTLNPGASEDAEAPAEDETAQVDHAAALGVAHVDVIVHAVDLVGAKAGAGDGAVLLHGVVLAREPLDPEPRRQRGRRGPR